MKRILYLLPFILLVSCKQTRFVCNQKLVSKPAIAAVTHCSDVVLDSTIDLNNFQKGDIVKQDYINYSEKKLSSSKQKTTRTVYQNSQQRNYIYTSPQDTTIKNTGLQKAKDAMDDEANWITAYFIFWGLFILFVLTLFGAISFGIVLSEEILFALMTICGVGILTSFIVSLFKNRKNMPIVEGYHTEEKRHQTHRKILLLMIIITCCL